MKKDIFNIRQSDLSYGRGYVYSLQYHIVWCTKYRRCVLTGEVEDACRKILCGLAEEYHFRILAMEIMPDHVHLLIDAKPQLYIPDIVKEKLWGGHLWNPSYCVVTVSDRSRDQVMRYIESQKEKAWSGRGRPPGSGRHRQS